MASKTPAGTTCNILTILWEQKSRPDKQKHFGREIKNNLKPKLFQKIQNVSLKIHTIINAGRETIQRIP